MTPHLVAAVDSAPFVFLSGQLPFDANRQIPATDIEGQTRQAIANLAEALASMRLSLDDVVKTTAWLTRASDYAGFDAAYADGFGAHRPARSTVVGTLVVPSALIEIEAIARRPAAATREA